MTTHEPSRRRPRRRAPRGTRLRVLLAVAVAVLFFLLGIAFSRALDERPTTGDPVTTVQTLAPGTQEAPSRTVTETATGP